MADTRSTLLRRSLHCVVCGSPFAVPPYRLASAKCCTFACGQTLRGWTNAVRLFGTAKVSKYLKLGRERMHRTVMRAKLGRPLRRIEVVHHIDGNKRNNAPSNLRLEKLGAHTRRHNAARAR